MARRGKKEHDYCFADNLYKDYFGKGVKKSKNKKGGQYSKFEENDIERFAFNQAIENYQPSIKCVNVDQEGLDVLTGDVINHYEDLIYIPERPIGAEAMSQEELRTAESESYFKWRCDMLEIQKHVPLTPFELNLEFWRQLWRVIERSDVLTQIVDARNPLLYRCRALERYVKRIDENKTCVLLINKSDFLTAAQRKIWAEYFDKEGIRVFFWSAKDAEETNNEIPKTILNDIEEQSSIQESLDEASNYSDDSNDKKESISSDECYDSEHKSSDSVENITNSIDHLNTETLMSEDGKIRNSSNILNKETLLRMLEEIPVPHKEDRLEKKSVIGLIGYPNVGKSSTINSMYGSKKASVSATPGRTKTFQTLHITDTLLFCDCPGLIFPSVVNDTSELMLAGIIPIDKSKNLLPAANLIVNLFPKRILEGIYNVDLKKMDVNQPLTGYEFLSAVAFGRGMVGKNKSPFVQQAARLVLKDHTSGKLLYRYPPPSCSPEEFESAAPLTEKHLVKIQKRLEHKTEVDPIIQEIQRIDFVKKSLGCHTKEIGEDVKKTSKKHKRPVREKARRLYQHLNP